MYKINLVRIITPLNTLYSDKADIVILPGEAGEFGVLANHESTIAALKGGVIKIINDTKEYKFFILEAIAKVYKNEIEILAESCIDLAQTQRQDITNRISEIQNQLSTADSSSAQTFLKQNLLKYQQLLEFL